MTLEKKVVEEFRKYFGGEPDEVVRAPGRVNLIGEHTDYNGGFVMPMAINRAMFMAIRYRSDKEVHLLSADFHQPARFRLDDFKYLKPHWVEYIKGVANGLQKRKLPLQGWEGVMLGDVPRGSGLSSSAALELAAAKAFSEVSNFPWDPVDMAVVGQEAENDWVGVNCGIMDQMISSCGQAGHAYLLDCRSLEGRHVPLPDGVKVVILDTGTRRGLVDSAYNERRQQCEEACEFFGVALLRDVRPETFFAKADQLPELTRKRARHVITEDQRTLEAAEVMAAGNAERLGELMDQSHVSLRDDFEVSNDALNEMVEISRAQPGCLGARMTGAGFGGCAVALVQSDAVDVFAENVMANYNRETKTEPAVYVTEATQGACRLEK
ncbi:galactokinase [Kiritimatiellaeota bacterium B1221]|nr:galactokinase [Kiritimatiellaeota bacterium B1221]